MHITSRDHDTRSLASSHARYVTAYCLMTVVIRETQSCDPASSLSLVYKALPYMGIENSSDSEAHHLIMSQHTVPLVERRRETNIVASFCFLVPSSCGSEDLVLRPGPPTGASTGAERDGGHATEPADPRMASSAQCHQPVDPLILGPNG